MPVLPPVENVKAEEPLKKPYIAPTLSVLGGKDTAAAADVFSDGVNPGDKTFS